MDNKLIIYIKVSDTGSERLSYDVPL